MQYTFEIDAAFQKPLPPLCHDCSHKRSSRMHKQSFKKLPEASSEKYIDAHGLGLLCVQKKLSVTLENSTCLTKEALQFSKEDFSFVVKLCYKHM